MAKRVEPTMFHCPRCGELSPVQMTCSGRLPDGDHPLSVLMIPVEAEHLPGPVRVAFTPEETLALLAAEPFQVGADAWFSARDKLLNALAVAEKEGTAPIEGEVEHG